MARKKEAALLKKHPQIRLVNAITAELNLPPDFRKTSTVFKNQIDEAVLSILRKKPQARSYATLNAHQRIMNLKHIPIDDRYQWVNYVNERIDFLNNNGAKSVTPK